MKKIKAIVCYPVEIEISVPDDTDPDHVWHELIKEADLKITQFDVAPVLYQCSEPMGKKHTTEDKSVNTQEEWVQFILQKLQQSKSVLDPIVSALSLLKPKARPEVILMAYNNLCQAIDYLIASVSPTTEFEIVETTNVK